jgi:hypothetical protein
VAHAERLGQVHIFQYSENVRLWLLSRVGGWDEVLPATDDFLARSDAGETHYHEGAMRVRRAEMRLARDDVEGALADVREAVRLAHVAGDPQQRTPWLARSACILVEADQLDEARAAASGALDSNTVLFGQWALADLALVAVEVDCVAELAKQVTRGPDTTWAEAALSAVRGDLVGAADVLETIGDTELESRARLRAARQLVADGRRREADEQLEKSLAFWRSVRATRYIRECEALLDDASEVPA